MMDKKIYSSKYAQDSYEALRTTSREGINQTPESIQKLDNLLSPLLKKGQSEYSCAVTPQVRQTGNRLSGLAGTAYASLLT